MRCGEGEDIVERGQIWKSFGGGVTTLMLSVAPALAVTAAPPGGTSVATDKTPDARLGTRQSTTQLQAGRVFEYGQNGRATAPGQLKKLGQLTITCPQDQISTSQDGTPIAVTFSISTSGAWGASADVSASPASGSLFPLGQTTVVATASSADGQVASCSFLVTVTLTPPLALSSVPNQTVVSSDGSSVPVVFPLPTASGGIPPYSAVTCSPASGDLFPLGTTTDACLVSDSESPSVIVLSTFTVTVAAVGGALTISWNPNAPTDNVTDYQILYGQASGQYGASLDTGLSTSGTLTGLTAGTTYYIAVRAFNGLWSGPSAEVTGTP